MTTMCFPDQHGSDHERAEPRRALFDRIVCRCVRRTRSRRVQRHRPSPQRRGRKSGRRTRTAVDVADGMPCAPAKFRPLRRCAAAQRARRSRPSNGGRRGRTGRPASRRAHGRPRPGARSSGSGTRKLRELAFVRRPAAGDPRRVASPGAAHNSPMPARDTANDAHTHAVRTRRLFATGVVSAQAARRRRCA